MRRPVLLATALAVAVSAIGLVWRARSRRVGEAPAGQPVAFQLRQGAAKAYRLAISTTVSPLAPGAAALEVRLDGRLNLRVARGGPRAVLAVQLSPVQAQIGGERHPAMEKALSAPFLVDIDSSGQLGESRFQADLAQADRAVLDGAIRALQVVLPRDPVERWETTETDQSGAFQASYRRGQPPSTLRKQKLRYTTLRPAGVVSARVLASEIQAGIGPDRFWLERASGTERLQFEASGGRPLAAAEASFALEPAGVGPDPGLALWGDLEHAAIVPRDAVSPASSTWDALTRDDARRRFAGVTLDALLARAAQAADDASFAWEVAAYLRAFPEEAARIPRRLLDAGDRVAALLVHALELAGTPEAQRALLDVAEGRQHSRANRLRALIAMSGLEHPTGETLERLGRLAHAADRSSGDVPATALLALGALAPRAPGSAGVAISGKLVGELGAATDPEKQRALLLAVENAGGTLPPDVLRAQAASRSAGVREVAARMIGRQDGASATPSLVGLLATEPNPAVRGAIVDGLLARPPDGQANGAIARALSEDREPDPAVRARMVAYLSRQLATFPANREVLRARLDREPDRGVVLAILNTLRR